MRLLRKSEIRKASISLEFSRSTAKIVRKSLHQLFVLISFNDAHGIVGLLRLLITLSIGVFLVIHGNLYDLLDIFILFNLLVLFGIFFLLILTTLFLFFFMRVLFMRILPIRVLLNRSRHFINGLYECKKALRLPFFHRGALTKGVEEKAGTTILE